VAAVVVVVVVAAAFDGVGQPPKLSESSANVVVVVVVVVFDVATSSHFTDLGKKYISNHTTLLRPFVKCTKVAEKRDCMRDYIM